MILASRRRRTFSQLRRRFCKGGDRTVFVLSVPCTLMEGKYDFTVCFLYKLSPNKRAKVRYEVRLCFPFVCLVAACSPPKKKSEKWQIPVPYCGNPYLRRIKDDSPFEGKYSCFSTTTEFEHFLERQSRLITWLLLASAPPPPPAAPLTPSPFRLSAVSRLER